MKIDVLRTQIGKFEINIYPNENRGWFEHDFYGDELGGSLEFEGRTLVDFDGVSVLPIEVGQGIRELQYICDFEHFCE